MSKKILINGLYVLSIILLLSNMFIKGKSEDIEMLYWLGMLVFAVAAIIQQSDKKSTEETEK